MEDSPVCHHCLDREPVLSPLRGRAAGEAGDLLGDTLPPGPVVCDFAFLVEAV